MSFWKHLKRDKYIPYQKDNKDLQLAALHGSSMRSKEVGDNILKSFKKYGFKAIKDGKPWNGKVKNPDTDGGGAVWFDIQTPDGDIIPNAVLKVIYHQQGDQYMTFAEIWDRKRYEEQ